MNVYIITRAVLQADGVFTSDVDSVWGNIGCARKQLKRTEKIYKGRESMRAKCPIGQVDDLSVQYLKNDIWHCKEFYTILTKEVKTTPLPGAE